ncbi:hypothetical protein Nepgr_011701 [Nepenthes gracilis]|uniref:Thaumatin-like protein n=1 Tax=Nepenthes gracilis TaxID=150966 RepID=A0AAD3SEJ6_NEPGR|nr:hypothetical protein Nepgr_011701 [Nepenthes gracilis]
MANHLLFFQERVVGRVKAVAASSPVPWDHFVLLQMSPIESKLTCFAMSRHCQNIDSSNKQRIAQPPRSNGGQSDVTFNFINQCVDTIWVGSTPSIGILDPEFGPENLVIFDGPDRWSGIMWARTNCTTNSSGYFSCDTGDCGTGEEDCQGPAPPYPVTLLNFTINNPTVSYQINLNHGWNKQVRIRPDGGTLVGGSGPCPEVDCSGNIQDVCPSSLVATGKNGLAAGCFSPCDGYKDPKTCCTGDFSGPQACQPSQVSQAFKGLCPQAHTYPADNDPPIYTCKGAAGYNVTFCPL